MRRLLLSVIVILLCVMDFTLLAQGTFTDAYQRFRPYHYQTP